MPRRSLSRVPTRPSFSLATFSKALAVALAAGLLSGCATLQEQAAGNQSPNDGLTCADRSYDATLADGGTARQIAETALLAQLADARGDMISAGFHRLRYERTHTQCMPLGLGGETHCRAAGTVCGRMDPRRSAR